MISNLNCLSAATVEVFSAFSRLVGVLCFKDPDRKYECKCTFAFYTNHDKELFYFYFFLRQGVHTNAFKIFFTLYSRIYVLVLSKKERKEKKKKEEKKKEQNFNCCIAFNHIKHFAKYESF